jgi:predicted RNase H-like HicB family nuclease
LNKSKHDHKFNIKITRKNDGGYVAQVVEIPSMIVQSDNKENLKDQITIAADKYFREFPEEHERILKIENGVEEMNTATFEQMTITA